MAQIKLTKSAIDGLKPAEKVIFHWDNQITGFGLKQTPTGNKIFILQYRMAKEGAAMSTAPIRITIGRFGPLTLDQAQKIARELLAKVALGIDPREEQRQVIAAAEKKKGEESARERLENDLAFDKLAFGWLDYYRDEKDRRPSSLKLARTVMTIYLIPAFADSPLPNVTKSDFQRMLDAIPSRKKAMKRQVYAYANIFWKWAVARDYCEVNPLSGIEKPVVPKSRDRFLDDTELKAVWGATFDVNAPFGSMYRLLLLTGKRISEASNVDWSEFDRQNQLWTIPAHRAKNGLVDLVPLSGAAIAEIDALAGGAVWPDSGYALSTTGGRRPISGFGKAKIQLDEQSGVTDWRTHDIRRTVATGLQKLGVRLEVTEAVLAHISGSRSGVAGVYQRHDWASEKRAALEAWSQRLLMVIEGQGASNVVHMDVSNG